MSVIKGEASKARFSISAMGRKSAWEDTGRMAMFVEEFVDIAAAGLSMQMFLRATGLPQGEESMLISWT